MEQRTYKTAIVRLVELKTSSCAQDGPLNPIIGYVAEGCAIALQFQSSNAGPAGPLFRDSAYMWTHTNITTYITPREEPYGT